MKTEHQLRLRLACIHIDRILGDLDQLGVAAAAARVAQKELEIVTDGNGSEEE